MQPPLSAQRKSPGRGGAARASIRRGVGALHPCCVLAPFSPPPLDGALHGMGRYPSAPERAVAPGNLGIAHRLAVAVAVRMEPSPLVVVLLCAMLAGAPCGRLAA